MSLIEKLRIIYEDNHLIAVNKWNGIAVHDDESEDTTLEEVVKQYIKFNENKPGDVFLGVIHRIDKPVSGVVLFAKTSKGLVRMNEMMQKKQIQKSYLCLVERRPPEEKATLVHYLEKDKKKNYTHVYNKPSSTAKEAILHFELLASIGESHLMSIELETGRPHQIRAQLAKMGCPIKGDVKYGAKSADIYKHVFLHSYKMKFIHPVKKIEIEITADLPDNMVWNNFKQMNF